MIGNDIINKIGGGSGINSGSLINDLVELNRAPEQQRLDSREQRLETQISDYGRLRTALSGLESAVSAVANKDTFNAKSVSLPDTSLIALTELKANAVAGDYQLQIDQTAQSHTLSSGYFAAKDASVGRGEITLRFGDWNGALDSFGVNAERTGGTITIDETNDTLAGLAEAINDADLGVQASVVGDSNGYRLLLRGPSGANNELELSVSEDALNPGLGDFAFNETSQVLSQNQAGRDALLRVNGLQVSRESNRIADVIEGLEFDIFNSSPSEVINLNISADRSMAEEAIREFVAAYNTFTTEVEKLTGFDPEKDDFGSLRNDATAKGLVKNVTNFLGAAVPGLDQAFVSLGSLGIYTRRDGTLEIDEDPNRPNTNFRAAMDQNFNMVRDFFVPSTRSDNAKVAVNGFSARTQAGSYDVVITQNASRGNFIADPIAASFPLDTTGGDYSFTVRVDGNEAASISLPDGQVYNSGEELAAEFQALINLDATLQAEKASISVLYNSDTGALDFYSDTYGSDSRVSFAAVGTDMGSLGITATAGSTGTDVAGTIGGQPAFGYGNVLLPALNSPAEGLSLTIGQGATNATVGFSRGFAGGLTNLVDNFLSNSGIIKERENNINANLEDIEDDRADLERSTEAYRARLQSQFLAMESIVSSLNNTGNFLDGILDRLPFTAKQS